MRKTARCASATRRRYRVGPLADLDLGVFPRSRTAHLRSVCPRRKPKQPGVALAGDGGEPAVAGYFGQLPGVEPRPYILRFTEDKPNPLYRKICYTFAWNAVITFTLLNLAGLVIAAVTGKWVMKQIYLEAYFPALCRRAAAGTIRPAAQGGAFDQG